MIQMRGAGDSSEAVTVGMAGFGMYSEEEESGGVSDRFA